MSEWNSATSVIVIIASSALLAAFATNWQKARQHRKEIVAGASKSALKRVEMYYRIRRRDSRGKDDSRLRDLFHDIQEDNDHYMSLLDIEAPWLGDSYRRFLAALKKELQPFLADAWAQEKAGGPSVQLLTEIRPDVDWLVRRFSKDGRRLFNPFMRPFARIRYSLRNFLKKDQYESK